MRRDLGVKTPDKINIDISVSMVLSVKRRCAIIGVKISEKEAIRMGMKTDILIEGIGCAGLNFIAEFAVNLVVSPAINTVVNAVKKHIKH